MKVTNHYFPVVLFSLLYNVILTFKSVDETLSVNIQVKATEQYFFRNAVRIMSEHGSNV